MNRGGASFKTKPMREACGTDQPVERSQHLIRYRMSSSSRGVIKKVMYSMLGILTRDSKKSVDIAKL